ncbi:phytanoyl-CoA dioxygenase family protein [Paenibacillus spongiae]|uniref:Phytanoyl-CoA dioxygenase family protein n=1 Tax=Paenibacillus spongiae TaxID=2909671 RepID=A0ABY5SAB3_9BACL|nr:phytanoyl-CoA dioxygenase family protein [Paenibacillus spongiae]UVI30864.1 phytanoyl-CoA dioxygenase family protein [Paenibacillus spongiae]
MKLSAEQVKQFNENGYLVVPGLLTPLQLEELKRMVDAVLDGTIKPDPSQDLEDFELQYEPAVTGSAAVPRRDRIRVAFHLCHSHPYFWNHAVRPEILDVVESLLGERIKLYTDQMFVKPAHHGSEVPFHQDHAYWTQVEPYRMISCWVALDDATVENGCVRMLPGTHHQLLPHREFEGNQRYGLLEEDVDAGREVAVEIKAGSAMFHHSLTVHRSFPNLGDQGRRGLVTIYMPADAVFVKPWNFKYGFRTVR